MGSTINLNEIKRFEVTEVYAHPDAKVDIVLIHGLNGNPRTTWTAKNGVFWPTELLPTTLRSAKARVLVYGYNADVYTFGSGRSASSDMIHQHAQSLLSNLALERKSEEVFDHPIIFVVHSLGGILLKRALELSFDLMSKNADDDRSIYVSTYGIIFLGTPHNGADAAKWGVILQGMVDALVPKKVMESEAQLVKTLLKNNETLQNINLHFLDIYQRFKICMVHEQEKTDLKGTKMLVVDQDSAGPMLPDVVYFGIEATHSNMCKFESKNSPGYLNISTTVKTWVQECSPTIQARWDMERKTRRQIREAQAAELLDIYPSPLSSNTQTGINTPDLPNSNNNSTILIKSTTSTGPQLSEHSGDSLPLFIKPPGFRPNSLFVGRESELAELHKLLLDSKRRGEGTSAVLIQSMPGGGKTHLARQYVYDHKDDWPGGIFWLRAKSSTELVAGVWDIARKAALKPAMANDEKSCLGDADHFIKAVTNWLKHRHDWLMVLDGVYFDDAEGLRQFIPDSANSGLIYTSTEKSVSGDYHWMNPQVMKLRLPSAREAQELLLLELEKKKPYLKEDLECSMELVHSMGFLPVLIHATAQRLKATDEPLGKFTRRFAAEAFLRGLGTYVAVVKQLKLLGAYEALNMIYILCFFGQWIPVDMISFGLKVLDVPIRASEPVTGRTLNNTFRILNMFALIDRNDNYISMHSSQSSKGSKDMLADNVDVLTLHSVVQGFFADTLLADGNLGLWLDRAIRVFCCSYDIADEKINRKTNAGLVEDYRMYEVHGTRLQAHLLKHHKKSPILDEAASMLETRLVLIKNEIERRTPESSQFITNEQLDTFQTSIFDRASSSSDTGPETPVDDNVYSTSSTWSFGYDKVAFESSPTKTLNSDVYSTDPLVLSGTYLPSLSVSNDPGYHGDEESAAVTAQSSQRAVVRPVRSPSTPKGAQQMAGRRKAISRLDHRRKRILTGRRNGDIADTFRAIDKHAVSPRISQENAQGFIGSPQFHFRGRLSGHSSAEDALTQIGKGTLSQSRGKALIRNNPSSLNGIERKRFNVGSPLYTAAAAGASIDTVFGYRGPEVAEKESREVFRESRGSIDQASFALAAPQNLPTKITVPLPTLQLPFVLGPCDPLSPGHAVPDSATYDISRRDSQEIVILGPDTYSSDTASKKASPIPTASVPHSSSSNSNFPYDYQSWRDQAPSNVLSPLPQPAKLGFSLSSPNFLTPDAPYYHGRPGYSNISHDYGYTSQLVSCDASRQLVYYKDAADRTRRRLSLIKTEPIPQPPAFDPRSGTFSSYQESRHHCDQENIRKSPSTLNLAAVSDRLNEWTQLGTEKKQLFPHSHYSAITSPFSPSRYSITKYPHAQPVAPANSIYSNASNIASSYPSPELLGSAPYISAPRTHPISPQARHISPYLSPHANPQSVHYSPQAIAATRTSPSSSHSSPPQGPQPSCQSLIPEEQQLNAPDVGRASSGEMTVNHSLAESEDVGKLVKFSIPAEIADGKVAERARYMEDSFIDERLGTVEGLGIRRFRV